MRFLTGLILYCLPFLGFADELAIHYINTGQGGSTLIVGPNGTSILYDFGVKNGNKSLIPYLKKMGYSDANPIEYAMLSHDHKDHYYGYPELAEAKIDIIVANYGTKESDSGPLVNKKWFGPAKSTTAGEVRAIPVGLRISLGDSAEAIVVAANGRLMNGQSVHIKNENDRSIALLIRYKNFSYIIDGDLGGGSETCSNRDTSQVDVQSHVVKALFELELIEEGLGIDVMHVSHHGSESSTSSSYVEALKPEVALISVGSPNKKYRHPRQDIIEGVLRGGFSQACGQTVVVEHIFQTDGGSEGCLGEPGDKNNRCTANATVGGDIVVTTDGEKKMQIMLSKRLLRNGKFVSPKPDDANKAELFELCLDEFQSSFDSILTCD